MHVENESESTESGDNEFFIGSVKIESKPNTSEFNIDTDNQNECKYEDKDVWNQARIKQCSFVRD